MGRLSAEAKQKVKARASTPLPGLSRPCIVLGCRNRPQLAAGDGLSPGLCTEHAVQINAHASLYRRVYSKAELFPYRRAAQRWLKRNRERSLVQAVLRKLVQLMATAGEARGAHDYPGLSAKQKAKATLARLRERKAPPEKLLVNSLAIWARLRDDGYHAAHYVFTRSSLHEFREVVTATLANRLAGGTDRTRSGVPMQPKFVRSKGRYLRVLGRMLDDVLGIVAEGAAEEVLALKPKPKPRGGSRGREAEPGAENALGHATRNNSEKEAPTICKREEREPEREPRVSAFLSVLPPLPLPLPPLVAPIGASSSPPQQEEMRGGGLLTGSISHRTPEPLPESHFLDPRIVARTGSPLDTVVADLLPLLRDPLPLHRQPFTQEDLDDLASCRGRWGLQEGDRMFHYRRQMRFEARPKPRTRRLSPRETQRLDQRTRILLGNIVLLILSRGPEVRLAVRMAHPQARLDRYTHSAHVGPQLPKLLDKLAALGLLTKHPYVYRQQLTTFAASSQLRSAITSTGATVADLDRIREGEEVIVLRDRSSPRTRRYRLGGGEEVSDLPKADYEDTDRSRLLRREMEEINAALVAADITLLPESDKAAAGSGGVLAGEEIDSGRGDTSNQTFLPIRLRPCAYRSFLTADPQGPQAFDQGGRIFGGFWQTLGGPDSEHPQRHLLRIAGDPLRRREEPTDLDFSGMYPRLAYASLGLEYPRDEDPYLLPSLEDYRDGVKSALSAIFGSPRPLKSLPKKIKAKLPKWCTAAALTALLKDKHRPIAHLFAADISPRLQYAESTIMVAVLLRLLREHRTVALPMHDGLMVAQSRKEIAKAVMEDESRLVTAALYGIPIVLPVREKPIAPPAHLDCQSDRLVAGSTGAVEGAQGGTIGLADEIEVSPGGESLPADRQSPSPTPSTAEQKEPE